MDHDFANPYQIFLAAFRKARTSEEEEKQMKDQLEALVAQMHGSGILYFEAKREFEKRFIIHVLKANKGNQCRAARELGMHRNTLSRTVTELKLDIRQFRPNRRMPVRSIIQGQAGKASA
jgi:DNA-binding NtrC family response regulator